MSVLPLSSADPVGAVLNTALDGYMVRQRVTADNIANVDTPDFRATTVEFESALRAAAFSGSPVTELASGIDVATAPTDTPVGANGNNVDLRKETLTAAQTQFQYQMMTRAVSDRFELVKIAAG